MSTITTDFRAPAVARSTAQRAADGLIAGYIHSLAQAAAKPIAEAGSGPKLRRLAAHAYECGAGRSSRRATRTRPALRRVPSPA
jgi:hypothetical protein